MNTNVYEKKYGPYREKKVRNDKIMYLHLNKGLGWHKIAAMTGWNVWIIRDIIRTRKAKMEKSLTN